MGYPPISDYALLSDCHSTALVSKDASIDWCCFHRFDARPVFARILDWERGGSCRIGPRVDAHTTRRYLPDTNVVETRFDNSDGTLVVVDCLPVRGSAPAGGTAPHPYHQLVRLLRCEAGEVAVDLEFRPRFDYGLTVPRLELHDQHSGIVYGGADGLALTSSIPLLQTELCGCTGSTTMRAGDEGFVAITYAAPNELRPVTLDIEEARDRVDTTVEWWQQWARRCSYRGPYRDAVVRSALVLKALTNQPTGAIVAAPTTSLPECIGGPRNWDYRYAWLRDGALNLYALFRLGYTDEAHAFMAWLQRTTAGRADQLQPLYGVGGERRTPEIELAELDGYRGSRPVRIGNAAAGQLQLDVYGELLDTAWLYHRHGGDVDDTFWTFLRDVVNVVEDRWQQPDEGIWEVRDQPRHFTSSKAMAWVAVDRAVKLAHARGLPADLDGWRRLRHDIRRWIDDRCVDPDTGAFTQSADSREPDASTLLLALTRYAAGDDPRVAATVRQIEQHLTVEGLVYRYRCEDGLPGDEGAFLITSFWLVDALALIGEHQRATTLFERLLGRRNDLGLLAEQIDPHTGDALGNFPQAFSHAGLIGAALNLTPAAGQRGS